MNHRKAKGHIFRGISYISAAITVLILIAIISKIGYEGFPHLSLEFLLTPENKSEGLGGSIGNAIVGTIFLSIGSTILATPFAVGTAIYIKKYAKDGPIIRMFSFLLDVLSGTPSIIIGVFGLLIFVFYMYKYTGGFSFISGIIALAILIIPVIERAAEEAIDRVPAELEEGSYSLGATKWETIIKITIPYALTGIMTGIVLSVGRAAEESAIVILTAGYSQFYPEFKVLPNEKFLFGIKIYPLQDVIGALPITVYNGFEYPHMVSPSESFAAAFVLIIIVMLINLVTKYLVWRRRIG